MWVVVDDRLLALKIEIFHEEREEVGAASRRKSRLRQAKTNVETTTSATSQHDNDIVPEESFVYLFTAKDYFQKMKRKITVYFKILRQLQYFSSGYHDCSVVPWNVKNSKLLLEQSVFLLLLVVLQQTGYHHLLCCNNLQLPSSFHTDTAGETKKLHCGANG